jgi:hypothetical protein
MSNIQRPQDYNSTREEFLTAKATATRAVGDLVYISSDSTGLVDLTIADDATVHRIARVCQAGASGDYLQYQTAGICTVTVPSATYTATHGLKVLDGAVASTGSTAAVIAGDANTSFAAIKVGGTTVTEITIFLYGEKFTATT